MTGGPADIDDHLVEEGDEVDGVRMGETTGVDVPCGVRHVRAVVGRVTVDAVLARCENV